MTSTIEHDAAVQALADIERTEVAAFAELMRRGEEVTLIMVGCMALAWTALNQLAWVVADRSWVTMWTQLGLILFVSLIAFGIERLWQQPRMRPAVARRLTRPMWGLDGNGAIVWLFRLPLYMSVVVIITLGLQHAFPQPSPRVFSVPWMAAQLVGFQVVIGTFVQRTPLCPLVFMVATAVVCGVLMWVPVANQAYVAAYGMALVPLVLGAMSRFANNRGWAFP